MQIDFNQSDYRPGPAAEDATAMDPQRRIRIAPRKTVEAPRRTLDQLMMMEMV